MLDIDYIEALPKQRNKSPILGGKKTQKSFETCESVLFFVDQLHYSQVNDPERFFTSGDCGKFSSSPSSGPSPRMSQGTLLQSGS